MKKTLFYLLFSIVCITIHGQNNTPKYNIPDDYKFVLPEDYTAYEPQIKEVINWYLWRSMGFDASKRQNAGAFFIQWLIGAPNITVEVDEKIVNFVPNNPELLVPFMMGWTQYALENNYSKDRVQGYIAGINTVIEYYNKNKGFLKKDKNIEEYEKMIKKKRLESYVIKNLPEKK